jgi:rfaE bifunctional protein kinase chain/domain
MKTKVIETVFECFSQKKVLIIGDVMIDSYMWGSVERISPEAPIPVVSISGRENRLGGASNVARNIKSLGAEPLMCSVIGMDGNGDEFLRQMESEGMITDGILRISERPTSVKTRIISSSQHLLRVDEEITDVISAEAEKALFTRVKDTCDTHSPDAIIFEDYDKGSITPGLIEQVVSLAKQMNIPVMVDPKKRNFLHYRGVTMFKPNYREMKEGMKTEFDKTDKAVIKGVINKLRKELQVDQVLLTLADAGAVMASEKEVEFVPAEYRSIADVSGAGDTVIATATLCMICGLDLKQVALIANMAGGLVCEYSGVVPVNRDDLLKELKASSKTG